MQISERTGLKQGLCVYPWNCSDFQYVPNQVCRNAVWRACNCKHTMELPLGPIFGRFTLPYLSCSAPLSDYISCNSHVVKLCTSYYFLKFLMFSIFSRNSYDEHGTILPVYITSFFSCLLWGEGSISFKTFVFKHDVESRNIHFTVLVYWTFYYNR